MNSSLSHLILTFHIFVFSSEEGVWSLEAWPETNEKFRCYFTRFLIKNPFPLVPEKVERSSVPRYNCYHHQGQVFNECLWWIEGCDVSKTAVLYWGSFASPPLPSGHLSMSGDKKNLIVTI